MLLPVVLGKHMTIGRGLEIGSSESYTFHTTPATFEEAKGICRQAGGSLAVVTSQEAEDVSIHYFKFG